MARLTNEDVKAWGQFYLRLIGTNAWNGFTLWAKTVFGGALAQASGLVDLRQIGWAGAGAILLGTIGYQIADALFRNPLPEPTAPPKP